MADISVPRTPTPGEPEAIAKDTSSPRPISSSDLTPPPSTQVPKHAPVSMFETNHSLHPNHLASPPATTRGFTRAHHNFSNGHFPTLEEARSLSDTQCRDLVLEIIPALGEARMALAHSKLQLNLLSIETAEAAQRAEAEHDLTRREVEVLQAGSPILRNRTALFPDPRSPLAQVQRHLESSINQGRELEAENHQLQRRLKQAKKVIKNLDAKNSQLADDNALLRNRIRQNREHFNEIRASTGYGLSDATRASTQSPQRARIPPANSGRPRKQDPLDALLMADQLLSGEPLSVPASPSPYRASKLHATHTRGTHSLSSLPTTPNRTRTLAADEALRTPINQIVPAAQISFSAPAKTRQREDRDSTISASEEEAVTDEDIPQSQASQAASSMLRRYPGPSSQGSPRMGNQERLVQAHLIGRATKPLTGSYQSKTRYDEDGGSTLEQGRPPSKRPRLDNGSREEVGLGIGLWSPER